jgi:hypothetical protein
VSLALKSVPAPIPTAQNSFATRIPFKPPLFPQPPTHAKRGWPLFIMPGAEKRLLGLSMYEQGELARKITDLAAGPYTLEGEQHKHQPMLKRRIEVCNFFIEILIERGEITVMGITFNGLIEKLDAKKQERGLYHVKRERKIEIRPGAAKETNDAVKSAWKLSSRVERVKTQFAAVNGQSNDLAKATWLMGDHATHAFPSEDVVEYTLFHNPTRGVIRDSWDSVRDKFGCTTEEAKWLCSILNDIQDRRQPTSWVVHSQGGLIFAEALRYHISKTQGRPLEMNRVVFDGNANNTWRTTFLLDKVGIQRLLSDEGGSNNYDFVHNVLGLNTPNPVKLLGSLLHLPALFSNNGGDGTRSTHTTSIRNYGQEAWDRQYAYTYGLQQAVKRVFR